MPEKSVGEGPVDKRPACFIIMPITTPPEYVDRCGGDDQHFRNVLRHLFEPAVEKAGYRPVPPVAEGDVVIQGLIIENLAKSDLVLCDLSIFNPNVFFELGIRTALDKPVTMVRDTFTDRMPFDVNIVNCHTYQPIPGWQPVAEIDRLSQHINKSGHESGRNSLWRIFGITAEPGEFKREDNPIEAKLDLVLRQMSNMTRRIRELRYTAAEPTPSEAVESTLNTVLHQVSNSSKRFTVSLNQRDVDLLEQLANASSTDVNNAIRIASRSAVTAQNELQKRDLEIRELQDELAKYKLAARSEATEPDGPLDPG